MRGGTLSFGRPQRNANRKFDAWLTSPTGLPQILKLPEVLATAPATSGPFLFTCRSSGLSTLPRRRASFRRSKIAQPPERAELRQALRLLQLHYDAAVLAVVPLIVGRVTQKILIAEFHSDFGRDVGSALRGFLALFVSNTAR